MHKRLILLLSALCLLGACRNTPQQQSGKAGIFPKEHRKQGEEGVFFSGEQHIPYFDCGGGRNGQRQQEEAKENSTFFFRLFKAEGECERQRPGGGNGCQAKTDAVAKR